jgi:hypothetical protein
MGKVSGVPSQNSVSVKLLLILHSGKGLIAMGKVSGVPSQNPVSVTLLLFLHSGKRLVAMGKVSGVPSQTPVSVTLLREGFPRIRGRALLRFQHSG